MRSTATDGVAPTKDSIPVAPDLTLDERLTSLVSRWLFEEQPLDVLDAGCGRMWTWDLEGLTYRLTGVDDDADALALRQETIGDLDEAIVSDLRTVDLEPESYDLVHSAYVLEHVDGAELVLDRMAAALRPGGLMVVKIPDKQSVYGFLTRLAPHRVHVWYKRLVRRRPLAGTPGHGPYPVVYDDVIGIDGIAGWAETRGLSVVAAHGDNSHLRFFGPARHVVDVGLRLVAVASLGRLTARYSNIAVVLAKP